MTSLKDSAIRNMPGTAPLLLLGQPVSFLKLLRRLGQMAVGVDMLTCKFMTVGKNGEKNTLDGPACLSPAPPCVTECTTVVQSGTAGVLRTQQPSKGTNVTPVVI